MAGLFIFSEKWLTVDCLFTPSGMQRQRECWLATCWQNPRVVKKLKQNLVVWPAMCFHCWGSCTGECLFSLYAVNTFLPLCVSKLACLLTDPYLSYVSVLLTLCMLSNCVCSSFFLLSLLCWVGGWNETISCSVNKIQKYIWDTKLGPDSLNVWPACQFICEKMYIIWLGCTEK